jgi:methyl-accepting chemotaxis protein
MSFKFQFQTIKAKFTAVTMIIVALVTALLTIDASYLISKSSYDSMYSLMEPLNNQVSNNILSMLERQLEICDKAATSQDVIKSYFFSASPLLQNPVDENRAKAFAVFKPDSSIWMSSGNTLNDFKNTETFSKALAGEQTISLPYASSDGKMYIDIATPVFYNNAVIYVVVYTFDIDVTINDINSFSFGDTGFAIVLDSNGTVIAGKGDAGVNYIEQGKTDKKYKSTAEFFSKAVAAGTYGTGEFNTTDGKKAIACYNSIDKTNWYVIIGASKKEYSRNIVFGIITTLCVGIALMLVAFFITQRLVANVMRPVVTSSQRLQALSNGDINSPVSTVYGADEISVLSRSLDETVSALKIYISKINSGLTAIAEGNLAYRMDGDWRGDFIRIKTTFNEILNSLCQTFANIDSASQQVNDGAIQVSNGAQALSQGATEQSAAIAKLAEQVMEVSKQVDNNAKAVENTTVIVDQTTRQITSCNDEMNNMLASMNDIKKSSDEISKIIKVIDDIAFQTNILALNAAVEAARAGAAGKGFAVVADEVRNLAVKSAEAANQTTSLIENSIKAVKKGSSIAKDTAEILDSIVKSAQGISVEIKNISDASNAQAEAIKNINEGVEQISLVIQSNTATAEESAAASEELSGQSNLLKQKISKFKYERTETDNSDDNFDDYFAPSNNNYSSGGDIFAPQDNGFSSGSDPFEPQDNGFGSGSDPFEPQDNGFGSGSDPFEPQDNGFGSGSDPFEPQDNGFSSGSDPFEPQDNGFSSGSDPFEPQDNGFGSGSDPFEPQDNGFNPSGNDFQPISFDPDSFKGKKSKINLDDDFENVNSKY